MSEPINLLSAAAEVGVDRVDLDRRMFDSHISHLFISLSVFVILKPKSRLIL